MVVWEQLDYCKTLTINSITVVTAGDDHGTVGIEPVIYLARDPADLQPRDGGYQLLWDAQNNGGNDMASGTTRYDGFPITFDFCGNLNIHVAELDGGAAYDPDPTQTDWDSMAFLDNYIQFSPTLAPVSTDVTFSGAGHTIRLNIQRSTVGGGIKPLRDLAGVIVAPDGSISKPQFALVPPNGDLSSLYNPVVASDGTNFLVAWEVSHPNNQGAIYFVDSEIESRLFDANGNPLGDVQFNIDPVKLTDGTVEQPYANLTNTWIGDRYRVTRHFRKLPGITGASEQGTDLPYDLAWIVAHDISSNGVDSPGRIILVTHAEHKPGDAANLNSQHSLAYDPTRDRSLLVYQGDGSGRFYSQLFQGNTPVGGITILTAGLSKDPQAVYHPNAQSWLISWRDATNNTLFDARLPDLSAQLVGGTQPQFPSLLATNSLACPAAQSTPVVDLRFEELPGVTTFADASGRGNSATCSGASCPAAGVIGAPKLLILDEPSGGLAPIVIDRILNVAAELCRSGMSILLVEQIVEKALRHAHRCYLIETGRVVGSGLASEMIGSEALHSVYLGKPPVSADTAHGP